MRRATERGMLGATDLADHLAVRGVPFREAHAVVGRIVRDRLAQGEDLVGLTTADLRRYDERFGDDAAEGATIARALAARRSPGGTAPERVREALAEARRVFALTLVPAFFTKCGFTLTSLGRLPEKSAAECPVCPKRFACDEHAMLLHLDGSTPPPLTPGEPVGYTRLFLHTEPR